MAKYIKCDCCGKRIEFGTEVYQYGGYCGVFCSTECFAHSYADEFILDDDLAENCSCTVYNDEEEKAIIQEISSTKAEIAILEERLKDLECALKICTS